MNENKTLNKLKRGYLTHTSLDKPFKDTVVNEALSCFHEDLLKITLTVLLSLNFRYPFSRFGSS